MYQSTSSTTETVNFDDTIGQYNDYQLGPKSQQQHDYRLQQIDQQYLHQKNFTSANDDAIDAGRISHCNSTIGNESRTQFPKFDEFSALIESEELLGYQVCKQESLQQQLFCADKGNFAAAQQDQKALAQQVNSLCAFEKSPSENNNISDNATKENTSKAPIRTNDISNIGPANGSLQPARDQQESLLMPQVQSDEDEGHRLQYQLMKETIYQETKSFFCDNYNPTEESDMASNMNSNHHHHHHHQQSKSINYNNASYRDIYDNMIKQEKPYVEIVEQPAKCSLRFRYKCEGRSAGSLPGVNSSAENKTYPTIQIRNYTGRAVVVISCVTKDAPYLAHPHNIVGKEGCKKGVCTVVVNNDPTMIRSFSSLGIQCVKRKDIEESLTLRESINVDPFRNGFGHKLSSSNIDLNVVRLCFQVFIEGSTPNKCDVPLNPVVSDPIHDKKAMSDLVITKLSHCTAPASGGREVILLCDRISRDDIQIRFFEERDGKLIWETYTELAPTDVHKQVAICFRTPKYFNEDITQPVSANIQLKRLSDNQVSEPRLFKFLPCESDEDMISRKRQKIQQLNHNLQHQQQQHQHQHHHHHHHHLDQLQTHHQAHSQQQHQVQLVAGGVPQAQSHLQARPSSSQKQQQPLRAVMRAQDSPFQHPSGRGSSSPQSRLSSPVAPGQASSPVAPALLERRLPQSPSPSPGAHHISQPMQDQKTYAMELLQQHNSVVRREIIADDGKVVRLVDRPSQYGLAQANTSDDCRDTGNAAAALDNQNQNQQQPQQQQRLHEDSNKAPLGLSLARIDSDQLMRADMAFNPNMNLDLGSSISIHLNGGGGAATGNGAANSHAAVP